ncbi:MAG: sprT domain-containing protein [Planctomycetia bacterium]
MDGWIEKVPEGTAARVRGLLAGRRVVVRVARPRRTKLGDHRPPGRGHAAHRISVNEDLNPYAFLTTLLHEIAHLATWERLRHRVRRYPPHGREWKEEFGAILEPFVDEALLPPDIAGALAAFMRNPAAASCSDRGLVLALAKYDRPEPERRRLEDLPAGSLFRVDTGRVFRLGPRLRSRYRCFELPGGEEYRVHGLSCVVAIPVGGAAKYRTLPP